MAKFYTNYGIFSYCDPQSPSYSKLRPAETFSIQMWPLDGFELAIPVLTLWNENETGLI